MCSDGAAQGLDYATAAGIVTVLDTATVVTDRHGQVLACNESAQRLLSVDAEEAHGRDVYGLAFVGADRGSVAEVFGAVLKGQRWRGRLPIRSVTGAEPRAVVWSAVHLDGSVAGTMLQLGAPDAFARVDGGLAHHLARVARVTSELLVVQSLPELTDVVIGHLAAEASATVASLSLLVNDDTLELAGLRGGGAGVAERWARYAVSAPTPAGLAVRTGEPVFVRSRAEFVDRFPGLGIAGEGERSILCLPLRVAGASIGVLTLSFPVPGELDEGTVEFYGVVADAAAQALARIQARAEAEDRATKLSYLAQASAELASSLDYEVTLGRVAHMAVPWFADWCAIALEQDGLLRTLAVAHADPEKVRFAEELQGRYPANPEEDRGSYRVLRTGESELTSEITDEMLAALIADPEQLEIIRSLDFRSAMVVPLKTEERTLGVVTWVAGRDGRRFDAADLALGEDLARRAAVAIDNSQLHSEQRQLATQLQNAVLSGALPELAGAQLVGQYRPSGRTEAGGDFYDAVALGHRRVALVVGDVMGRGVSAAARMAQTRSAVRTLIALDPDPAVVFERLDGLFESQGVDELVTMVYAIADLGAGTLQVTSAGHPPPLVIPPEGPARSVEASGLVLGAGGAPRESVTVPFSRGDQLLLFTDGLIERRDEDLDVGLARLSHEALALRGSDLASAIGSLVMATQDPTRDDDIAVLVLRHDS